MVAITRDPKYLVTASLAFLEGYLLKGTDLSASNAQCLASQLNRVILKQTGKDVSRRLEVAHSLALQLACVLVDPAGLMNFLRNLRGRERIPHTVQLKLISQGNHRRHHGV